jgi:3-hydroxybutyryl-CoA dehydrogenase
MRKSVEKGFLIKDKAEKAIENISYVTDLQQAVADSDIVIEVVIEVIDVKIDVFRNLDTSDETVAIAREVGARLGKETVEVNEYPGFVSSRMNCLIGNGAMNMLMEGEPARKISIRLSSLDSIILYGTAGVGRLGGLGYTAEKYGIFASNVR